MYRKPAEERLPAGFSFCTDCGIIFSTNPPGLSKKRNRVDI
nr:MAG TPA: NINTH ZINC-FINGER DOMAIN OF THE-finger, beta-hairpin + alpha-helix, TRANSCRIPTION [Caudoviricetes sp.]